MKGKKPIRKRSRLCEDNIKMDFKQSDAEVWLWFDCLRTESSDWSLRTRQWLGGFHEKSGVFSLDERSSLSEAELSSTHLITSKYQIISSVSRNINSQMYFFVPQKLHLGPGRLIVEVPRSLTHTHTHHSVGLLWNWDRPVAETFTRQLTTFTRNRYSCTRRDSNPQSQQARGRRPSP